MIITSPSFKDGEFIPSKFSCDGSTLLTTGGSTSLDQAQDKSLTTGGSTSLDVTRDKSFTAGGGDINPELQIQNVPAEAKSLALIMHDPDAPMAGGFTHWLVWNIDPKTTLIKEESVPPQSTEGKNDAQRIGYIGPCPPSGIHHYHFKLYALDAMLNLNSGAEKSALETEIKRHLIAQAEVVGLYQKK